MSRDKDAPEVLETCKGQGRNAARADAKPNTRPVGAIPPLSCTTDAQRLAWLAGYLAVLSEVAHG